MRVNIVFPDKQKFEKLYTKDISKGGVFILTDEPLEPFSKIEVVLKLKGEKSGLTLSGEVVHSISPEEAQDKGITAGMGVQFSDLDDDKRQHIERFLSGMLDQLSGEEIEEAAEPAPRPQVDPSKVDPQVMREAYVQQFPDRVETAAQLFEKALEQGEQERWKNMMGTLKMALQFDPFNQEFKDKLAEAEKRFETENA